VTCGGRGETVAELPATFASGEKEAVVESTYIYTRVRKKNGE